MKHALALLTLAALAGTPFALRAEELSAAEKAKVDRVLPSRAPAKPKRARKLLVLVYNVPHVVGSPTIIKPSIPYANYALKEMGRKTGAYTAVVSTDIEALRPENLKQYDAICFNNTTGVLTDDQALRDALLSFVAEGKGFVGFYAGGAVTFMRVPDYEFAEFGEMLGGFSGGGHPWYPKDTIHIHIEDRANPVNAAFGGRDFTFNEQVMQFRKPYSREKVRVLLTLDPDKSDYDAERRRINPERRVDRDFPMSWIKRYHKGRVFYTVFGGNPQSFQDARLMQHYLAGIQYAMGDLEADDTPSARLGKGARGGTER